MRKRGAVCSSICADARAVFVQQFADAGFDVFGADLHRRRAGRRLRAAGLLVFIRLIDEALWHLYHARGNGGRGYHASHERYDFDLIVIGGGSGGIAAARRAAEYGARVALVEAGRLGGTCVNVGCVPKKLMWNAAEFVGAVDDARGYGFDVTLDGHDWAALKAARDAYVQRLNGIYEANLAKSRVTLAARLGEAGRCAHRDGGRYAHCTASGSLLAPGGRPHRPEIAGAELGIDSDGFFALAQRPQRVTVVGGGYIAVEIAGVFAALGSQVTMVVRGATLLREFDPLLIEAAHEGLGHSRRAHHHPRHAHGAGRGRPLGIERAPEERRTASSSQDAVILATGRDPDHRLHRCRRCPCVVMNGVSSRWMSTSRRRCRACSRIGDVTGQFTLTPVAIAAGRRLADRIWGGMDGRKLDYQNIPTVVFGHPPLGTVGLTEPQALAQYGDAVKCFSSNFVPMYHALTDGQARTRMKLVTVGPEAARGRRAPGRPRMWTRCCRDLRWRCAWAPPSATSTTPWPFIPRRPKNW